MTRSAQRCFDFAQQDVDGEAVQRCLTAWWREAAPGGINLLSLSNLEGVEPPGIHLIRPRWGRDDKGLFLPKVTLRITLG